MQTFIVYRLNTKEYVMNLKLMYYYSYIYFFFAVSETKINDKR